MARPIDADELISQMKKAKYKFVAENTYEAGCNDTINWWIEQIDKMTASVERGE